MRQQNLSVNAEVLRVFGYFSLLTAAACCTLLFFNIRARWLYGASNFSFLGWVALYALVAGYGTIRLTKWGAILLSVPPLVAGAVFGALTIRQEQTIGAVAIVVAWLLLLSIPAFYSARSWRELDNWR